MSTLAAAPAGWNALHSLITAAMAQWWAIRVPVLFASLLAAEGLLWTFPALGPWAPVLLSVSSFPLVGTLWALPRSARRLSSRALVASTLSANLYNPLLFAHPGPVLALDLLALAVGVSLARPFFPPRRAVFRHPVEDAMNATTWLGAGMIAASLLHHLVPLPTAWWDPLTPGALPPSGGLTPLAVGGIVWILPLALILRRRGLPIWPLLVSRALMALLATACSGF
ncbi:MAG: hypothetical protein K6U14_01970 [Firmicutes bacterium]|nr:hypothetical protein [Alicyclobacillaceae bacterium]MCL6496387.1 hypothetical protein [Bacillota bacterium]